MKAPTCPLVVRIPENADDSVIDKSFDDLVKTVSLFWNERTELSQSLLDNSINN